MGATIRGVMGSDRESGLNGEIFFEDGKAYRQVTNDEASTALGNGDVVVFNPESTTGAGVLLTTTADNLAVAGVVIDTIPAGMQGRIQVSGEHSAVKVTGAVAVGDGLGTSTTATRAASTTTANALVGVAQEENASGTAAIRALIRAL